MAKKKGNGKRHDKYMKEMRERTGDFASSSRLVSFLYQLMRDHVPAGVVEKIMLDLDKEKERIHFCNGHLAQYANDVALRLGDDIL